MARRGVMTALQAALAGIGGAAGGYVQMEETKRKRMVEDEERKQRQSALEAGLQAGIRSEQRDILKLGGTRIAGMGEQVAGPVPSVIPLSGVGNALAAAEATGGPATSRGALRQIVGESSFMLPGEGERTARERETTRAFAEEDFQTTNKRDFNTFKALGGRGEYQPNVVYADMKKRREEEFRLAGQRSLLEAREGAKAGGAGTRAGATSRAQQIATLPTVTNTSEELNKLNPDQIKKLSGFGVAAASQVPKILTQTRGGFSQLAALPVATVYSKASDQEERQYAEYIRSITDAVASMTTVGVMTDYDIGRFESQVMFNPGDSPTDKVRKFNNLKLWASWLSSGGQGKYPGETNDDYVRRTSMIRAQPSTMSQQQATGGATAQVDAQTQRERDAWDTLAAQQGREYVTNLYGPRP